MNLSKVEMVCFDYYGTLVDIGKPFIEIKKWFETFLSGKKIPVDHFNMFFNKQRAKYFCSEYFMTGHEVLEKSYIESCKKYDIKWLKNEFNSYVDNLFSTPPAYKDALNTLTSLKKRYKIALITNADNDLLYKSVGSQGFEFDYILTSEDAKCNKPDKRIFEKVLIDNEITNEQVIMIGDSIREDINGAKVLGINTIWVNRDRGNNYKDIETVYSLHEILQYL